MDELFTDILEQGLDLRIKVTGQSMKPYINNGDTVILRKVQDRSLHRGDIIYFLDATGAAVLHRIIFKDKGPADKITFTTRGDALLMHDAPVTGNLVLAKAIYIEKVMPIIGPIQLKTDSAFGKFLNSAFGLYRKIRRKFLNRTALKKVFHSTQ
jgi:signal peptidase I